MAVSWRPPEPCRAVSWPRPRPCRRPAWPYRSAQATVSQRSHARPCRVPSAQRLRRVVAWQRIVLRYNALPCPLSFNWLQSRYNACIVTSLPSISSLLVTIQPSVLRHTFLSSQLLQSRYKFCIVTLLSSQAKPTCCNTV